MNFWRAMFLAAFVLGLVLGIVVALIALHAAIFFGFLTPGAEPDVAYAVEHAIPNFVGEKFQAFGTGVSVFDEIIKKAHAACPNQMGEN